jgi:hypothetical protein
MLEFSFFLIIIIEFMFESKACWSHAIACANFFRHDMKIGQYNLTMLNLQPVLIEELTILESKTNL